MGALDQVIGPIQLKLAALKLSDLNLTAVLVTPFLLLLTWYVTTVFQQYWKLRHVPGPFLNAITPLVCTYHAYIADINTYTYNLTRKYGPLVRISPNVVVFSDPETFRHICSYKAGYTKGLWFEFSRWSLEHYSCIAMRDNESRKERKTKLLPGWTGRGLELMETRVDAQVRSFVDLIKRKYTSTRSDFRPMDMGHRAMMYTLDVVTGITFGEAWGFLKKDGDVNGYIEMADIIVPLMGIMGSIPWLVYLMHAWPLNLFMPGAGDKVGFGQLMKLSSDQVKQRVEAQSTAAGSVDKRAAQGDLISSWIQQGVDPDSAVQECITTVVAGNETSSVALKFTLLSLLTTPASYRKVQAEIDAYYASRKPDPDSVISYADSREHFPYLAACLREAMRLWPPSAALFTKQVPDNGGDTLHGYYLPPGTEIGQCFMGIGRHADVFGEGEDVHIFRPERWFEAEPAKLEQMLSAWDLVFSTGKYVCLGKHVAMMELNKFFVEILRRFEVAIVDNVKPVSLRDPVSFMAEDFKIRFTNREVN